MTSPQGVSTAAAVSIPGTNRAYVALGDQGSFVRLLRWMWMYTPGFPPIRPYILQPVDSGQQQSICGPWESGIVCPSFTADMNVTHTHEHCQDSLQRHLTSCSQLLLSVRLTSFITYLLRLPLILTAVRAHKPLLAPKKAAFILHKWFLMWF